MFFLTSKLDLSNEELSPTGIKRAHSPESHVVKRTCYGDRIFSPQPAFYIRRQENGSFVKTPESWQKRKNNENLEAAGLSEFQLVQSQPIASMSDCEVYLLNVTPVSFLALLKMSAYSKCCQTHIYHILITYRTENDR